MSADEARIRVRMDFGDARGDLHSLYREMANPPGIRGGGGGGGGLSFGGAAGGGGGFNLMSLVKGAIAGMPLFGQAASTAWGLGGTAMAPAATAIERFMFGSTGAVTDASKKSIQQVQDALGLAQGFMGNDMTGAGHLFDAFQQINLPEARGRAAIARAGEQWTAEAVGKNMAEGEGGAVGGLLTGMATLVSKIDTLIDNMGHK